MTSDHILEINLSIHYLKYNRHPQRRNINCPGQSPVISQEMRYSRCAGFLISEDYNGLFVDNSKSVFKVINEFLLIIIYFCW